MPISEPSWWYGPPDRLPARLLQPLARIWGNTAARRFDRVTPYHSSLPVICVGNFTAGGTGKTPLSILIAKMLSASGERPAFLTRGYGGRVAGPHRLNPALDTADDVGDEPLLLANYAPVMIARDRAAGAAALERYAGLAPATAIVMDDGLQNPSLAKNLTIAVIDGKRGLGNGLVMPAGPLRAPLALQFRLASAILVNRPRGVPPLEQTVVQGLRDSFDGPVLEATIEPAAHALALQGARVLALAGIANPARFTRLLTELGAQIAAERTFRDHHPFTDADAREVLGAAQRLEARIITTEKDWVRLVGASGARGELRERAEPLPIEMRLEPRDAVRLQSLLDAACSSSKRVRVKS